MNCWQEAETMHKQIGLDYITALAYYQQHGHIISTPYSLIWGEEIMNSWLVYIAIGEGCIKQFVQNQPYWLPTFTFCRLLKNRHKLHSYSMERVAKYYNIDVEVIKQRSYGTRTKPNKAFSNNQERSNEGNVRLVRLDGI